MIILKTFSKKTEWYRVMVWYTQYATRRRSTYFATGGKIDKKALFQCFETMDFYLFKNTLRLDSIRGVSPSHFTVTLW